MDEGVQACVCGIMPCLMIKQVREALSDTGIQGAKKVNVCGMLNIILAVRAAPLLAWQDQPRGAPAGLFCAPMRASAQRHQRLEAAAFTHRIDAGGSRA